MPVLYISLQIKQLDDLWLFFTPDAFEKILLNLLSNAIKYTLANGRIDLYIKKASNERVEIIVSDTGIGIESAQQTIVFGRFNRVLNEHSEHITGAGIGLALVKELVEKHQGQITLQSELGQGSTFTVTLPAYAYNSDHESSTDKMNAEIIELEIESIFEQNQIININQQQAIDTDNKINILVVEDNSDMRNYISSTLTEHYHVLTANNGKQGLELATEQIPDLIISDVMMPEMDGYTLCRSLKSQELTSHIPLILLTARSDRDSRLQGWKDQADEYLTKPFDTEELLLRVENLLDIRKLLKERLINKIYNKNSYSTSNIQPISAPPPLTSPEISTKSNIDDNDIREWEEHEKLFINKFTDQLERNFSNPDLKVDQIAKNLAMSERQLYRKMKGILNVTPIDYLRSYRLEKAIALIKKGEPVSNVALDVGFTSHSYFSRCFKAKYGTTPSEFVE